MRIFKVSWKIPNHTYVPPDPCVGGDYYADKYGFDIITASTKKVAREAIKIARPNAIIKKAEILINNT
jgi:hypothetical protein